MEEEIPLDWTKELNYGADQIRKLSYYQVLIIPKNADAKQIRKSYYRLAKIYHPDKTDDPQAGNTIFIIQKKTSKKKKKTN